MADNIYTPLLQRDQYLLDNDGRTWPVIVVYTTDGNGDAVPLTGGGGGGGGDASAANQVLTIDELEAINAKLPPKFDDMQFSAPTATTEQYEYFLATVLVQTKLITYSDATKSTLIRLQIS